MAAGGQDQQRESHLISLKVMRLSRPSLVTGHSLYFGSPHGTPSASASPQAVPSTEAALSTDETVDMGDFGVSELLTMPASFGNIYLGETFTSYICANNESAHPVREVNLTAELQTSTARFVLSDTLAGQRPQASKSPSEIPISSPSSTVGRHIQLLESGKTNEMIVSHEIKELGIHILVCCIQYTTLDGQQKSFRKFYKFQVLNPLSVKTKVNSPSPTTVATQEGSNSAPVSAMSASNGGVVLLEAMVQNVSGVTMWMERMRFEVADAFTAQDLNVVIEEDDEETSTDTKAEGIKGNELVSIFGDHDYFAPNDVRQYLYVLTPKPGKELLAKTTNVLGKMDILWKSQFGETGRLQTSQLTRKPPPLDDISVQVVKVPERIRLEEIFSIEILVKNQSPSGSTNTMKLMLTGVKHMGAILLSGPNSRQLGAVPPGGEVRVRLDWFPLMSGVQKIGGIRIVDIISGYTVELEHLTNCFVEHT
ncbi:hypothetical protein EDD21DRAFT_344906 [Dissophora ornata]|nr:hypothetical protein EDD21DRAFT_344906 [Dissophora ornata]